MLVHEAATLHVLFLLPASFVQGFSASTAIPDLQTRSITLPIVDAKWYKENLQHAFEYIVEYSDYLEHSVPGEVGQQELHSSCRIPILNEDIVIDFYLDDQSVTVDQDATVSTVQDPNEESFTLKISGASLSDFGWICSQFYDKRDSFRGGLGTDHLRQAVIDHCNRQQPSPGFDASSSGDTRQEIKIQQDFMKSIMDDAQLKQLENIGFVVLEPNHRPQNGNQQPHLEKSYHVSDQSQEDISQYLVETTGESYRKDLVHFLSRPQAIEAGIGEHFSMLLSIASYLNDNLEFRASTNNPIAPATEAHPLTVPHMVQLAQYSKGGFYQAHSDNSLHESEDDSGTWISNNEGVRNGVRNNFRHYTCILYCNDLDESDGGALRLYLNSRNLNNKEAIKTCQYVDIIPKNGRLLIFDSCMVHSVEKVLSATKIRRALTLWILRPNDSGVAGESYF